MGTGLHIDLATAFQGDYITPDGSFAAHFCELSNSRLWCRSNRMVFHSNTPDVMFDASERLFHLAFLDSKTPVVAAQDRVQSLA